MAKNKNFTATGQVLGASVQGIGNCAQGVVYGFIVCSNSSGTLKLIDGPNDQVGRDLMDTYTFPAGSSVVTFPPQEGLEFYQGVYAVVGGTASIELLFDPRIN